MAGFLDRFRRRLTNEMPLFRTHQPEYQDPARAVGSLVDHEGTLYVVTRWEELSRVTLNRGGSVREWQVYGQPADPAAVEVAMGRAAERILADAESPTPDGQDDAGDGA
ncbi:MAG: hypothetical protein ACYC6T_01125 [Thermoleophilia bacterium]